MYVLAKKQEWIAFKKTKQYKTQLPTHWASKAIIASGKYFHILVVHVFFSTYFTEY